MVSRHKKKNCFRQWCRQVDGSRQLAVLPQLPNCRQSWQLSSSMSSLRWPPPLSVPAGLCPLTLSPACLRVPCPETSTLCAWLPTFLVSGVSRKTRLVCCMDLGWKWKNKNRVGYHRVYYESMERKLLKPIYECRCNGRLQTKKFTRLTHTGSVVGWKWKTKKARVSEILNENMFPQTFTLWTNGISSEDLIRACRQGQVL